MGRLINKKFIIDEYNRAVSNWEDAIRSIDLFIKDKNEYWNSILTIQFKIGVRDHIDFAKRAIEINKNIVEKIINNSVEEYDTKELEQLFNKCRKEHININRTYDEDLKYENSLEYYSIQENLMKFRSCVDEYKYLDDTLEFVRNMINNKFIINNIVDIKGDASKVQIQQNSDKSFQNIE